MDLLENIHMSVRPIQLKPELFRDQLYHCYYVRGLAFYISRFIKGNHVIVLVKEALRDMPFKVDF